MNRIILTGGGSAGHVTPNLAIAPELRRQGWQIDYLGSCRGIEKSLAEKAGIPYHAISTGKLRRYLDLQNFLDPFRVLAGLIQAYFLLGRLKPAVIFSKGGYVSLPVAAAGRLRGIPVVLHESDYSPGLANKLAALFAKFICVSFPETALRFSSRKTFYTGTPVRPELFSGNRERGLRVCGFNAQKPVLMVIGGSLGSERINKAVRAALPELLRVFQVLHICGKGNTDRSLIWEGYCQLEYAHDELAHIFAAADLAVSRAGANTLFELLSLRKLHLLIPLSKEASRGDQILNARSFVKTGCSMVLEEEALSAASLISAVFKLWEHKAQYLKAMENNPVKDGSREVINVIHKAAGVK
ncbi:MAG: undecaprenyldiphospho-muramoylpentapeptide beta-N-acetylglucosaminyltransferase [Bacillota bacterium]